MRRPWIADRLLSSKSGDQIAPLLQANMELLWQKCQREDGSVEITGASIQNFIDSHEALLNHYLEKIRNCVTEGFADDRSILDILAFYIEDQPASAVRLESEFQEQFKTDARAPRLLAELQQLFLLTSLGTGKRRATRLSHDVLAKVIRDRHTQLNARELDKAQNRRFELILEKVQEQAGQLQFPEVQKNLAELMDLGIRRKDLQSYLSELLFVWNEARREEQVREILHFWLDSNLLSESALRQARELSDRRDRDAIRKWLSLVDSGKYQDLRKQYLVPIGTGLVHIEGGSFEREGHKVQVDSFYMANEPTTFARYGLYLYATGQESQLDKLKPNWGIHADHPVIEVNWYQAIEYCNWLSEAQGLKPVYTINKDHPDPNNLRDSDDLKWQVHADFSASGFRLPTEAEWEFAARGGIQSKGFTYAGSDKLEEVAWYDKNSDNQSHPVAGKHPNELGLYDMSGNVLEWCWDWHEKSYDESAPAQNPSGPEQGISRVVRGGSWLHAAIGCRCSYRHGDHPLLQFHYVGFRVVRR